MGNNFNKSAKILAKIEVVLKDGSLTDEAKLGHIKNIVNGEYSRQEANRKILEKIAFIIEREPDWRFHQILQNIGVEDRSRDQWYDESVETLKGIGPSIQ